MREGEREEEREEEKEREEKSKTEQRGAPHESPVDLFPIYLTGQIVHQAWSLFAPSRISAPGKFIH